MTVIEHGDWQLYTPATLPKGTPSGAMFSRRVSDGTDWYDYVNAGSNFQTNTVKMTVTKVNYSVGAATTDPIRLFPGNGLILEITDVPLDDPQAAWGQKIYNPATKTFSDPPPSSMLETDAILDRIAALEAKLGDK